jgi:hypothetical protein
MKTVLMHFRNAWSDYFPGTATLLQNNEYRGRQTPSGTGFYITNCLFISITSSSSGGALYCSNSVTYFLVESSSFLSCKTSGSFGAIYFYHSSGQSVLYAVCSYDCCTTNNNGYQFAYLQVNNGISSKNYANYSSIIRCVNENSSPHYTLAFQYGNVCCPSVNSSLNKCYYSSGITCWPSGDSNSVTCSLTYCSFTDNHATIYQCIQLNTAGANFEIKSCNILRNTQVSLNSEGTIYISGYLKIYDSCILENTANCIFYQYSSSYTITLLNCTVDKTTCNLNVVTQSIITKSFILALNHVSTRNCHSEYDSAGILTPIIHSPSSSKRQIKCYTYMKCFNQLPTPQILLFFVSFYFSK